MRSANWILAGLLTLCTASVYLQVAGHDFITIDDGRYILENPEVAGGLTWQGLGWAFTTFYAGNWHPLTWIAHMANVQAFGLHAAGHHLVNVAWHSANAVLLFFVLAGLSGSRWRSAFVAALFSLHPLHVESVAWASELKDLLSAFFGLLSIHAYRAYAQVRSPRAYAGVLVFMGLSLLAKPMLVTLPLVLLLLDFWPLGRFGGWRGSGNAALKLVVEKLPLVALSALSGLLTYLAQSGWGAVKTVAHLPVSVRLVNAVISYATYLKKTIWPAGLAAYYPYPELLPPSWEVALATGLLVAVSILALWQAGRRPYLLVGWLLYLGTLVPVIGLVQVGGQALADRYTYVPLIGLFLALAWAAAEFGRKSRSIRIAAAASASVILLGLGAATAMQARHWRDTRTLFRHTVSVTTRNWMALAQLGKFALDHGEPAEAVAHFRSSLQINGFTPAAGMMRLDLGRALLATGRADEAIAEYRTAVRLLPPVEAAYRGLASALVAARREEEAVGELRTALRMLPGSIGARLDLAALLANLGRTYEAAIVSRQAVEIQDMRARGSGHPARE